MAPWLQTCVNVPGMYNVNSTSFIKCGIFSAVLSHRKYTQDSSVKNLFQFVLKDSFEMILKIGGVQPWSMWTTLVHSDF